MKDKTCRLIVASKMKNTDHLMRFFLKKTEKHMRAKILRDKIFHIVASLHFFDILRIKRSMRVMKLKNDFELLSPLVPR